VAVLRGVCEVMHPPPPSPPAMPACRRPACAAPAYLCRHPACRRRSRTSRRPACRCHSSCRRPAYDASAADTSPSAAAFSPPDLAPLDVDSDYSDDAQF